MPKVLPSYPARRLEGRLRAARAWCSCCRRFLDNIAAALIGGTMAHTVFRGKVHIGYLAAIVAASNAGGSGSVVGDTTTTMMWIDGVSPLAVLDAYVAAAVALVVCGIPAALQQQRYSPIMKDDAAAARTSTGRASGSSPSSWSPRSPPTCRSTCRFAAPRRPLPGDRRSRSGSRSSCRPRCASPTGALVPGAFKGTIFLLSLVTCASLMPVEKLPAASWQTTFGLGFVSAVFDNIPLTALALKQGGYDWGMLAYAVGFGGSMIWFGSSAGVALSNMYPEAKSVGRWLTHGWHVAVAYVIGFAVMLAVPGWHPIAETRRQRSGAAPPAVDRSGTRKIARRGLPGEGVRDYHSRASSSGGEASRAAAAIAPRNTRPASAVAQRTRQQPRRHPKTSLPKEHLHEQGEDNRPDHPPPIPRRRRRDHRRGPRIPDDREGAGADQHALAEHLAGEGHLPRVRHRLRQEGERHDRRRPQDRGAARRRVVPAFGLLDAVSKGTLDGGHGVLVYHYGKQNALALWGSGPAFGMDANMLLAWHKYGGGKELLNKLYASIGAQRRVVPVRPDADAAARLVQEADHQGRGLQGPQVPHRRHLDRRVHRAGRGGERAARRRDRAGDGPRPARRGRVQQRDLRPHPRLPRRLQGVHAAELPPERRAVRDHVQQDQVRRAAGEDEGDHRERGRGGLGRHVVEGDRPLLEGLRRAADQGQGASSTRRRTRCCRRSSRRTTRRRRSAPTTRCSGRSRTRRRRSPSARCAGTSTPT